MPPGRRPCGRILEAPATCEPSAHAASRSAASCCAACCPTLTLRAGRRSSRPRAGAPRRRLLLLAGVPARRRSCPTSSRPAQRLRLRVEEAGGERIAPADRRAGAPAAPAGRRPPPVPADAYALALPGGVGAGSTSRSARRPAAARRPARRRRSVVSATTRPTLGRLDVRLDAQPGARSHVTPGRAGAEARARRGGACCARRWRARPGARRRSPSTRGTGRRCDARA